MGELDNQSFDPTIKTTERKINTPPLSWDKSQKHQKLLTEKEEIKQKDKQDIHLTTFERIKKEHAFINLEKTNEKYLNSPEGDSTISEDLSAWGDEIVTRWLTENNTLNGVLDVNSKASLLREQNNFIDIILGKDKGFNSEYIKGFSNEKGNILIKISTFEKKIQNNNFSEFGSLEIANYISYLEEKGENYKIYKLENIVNNNKNCLGGDGGSNVNKKENEKAMGFLDNIWNKISNKFDKIKEKVSNIFDKITNFYEFNKKFKDLGKIGQEEMIIKIETNKEIFIKKIQNSLPNNLSKEEKIKKATDFVNNIISNMNDRKKILSLIKELNDIIEKGSGTPSDISKITNIAGNITDNQNKLILAQAIKKGASNEDINKIIEESKKDIIFYKKTSTLNSTQMSTLIEGLENGESFDNIIQEIAQDNEELKEVLEKEKSNPGVENKQNEEKKENNKYDIDDDDYIKSDSGYTIKLENGEGIPGLTITEEERDLTMGNPEALKNLINFYKFFKDLNLEGVWKYRKQLALSMGSVNININDNDSVSEAELLKFGKKIIQVINAITPESENKLSENPGNLNAMKAELRTYSGAGGALNEDATFNILGEDKFIAGLRKQGIIGGAYFHTMQLRKLMN